MSNEEVIFEIYINNPVSFVDPYSGNPLKRHYKHYITILKESISTIGDRNENIKSFLFGKRSFSNLLLYLARERV